MQRYVLFSTLSVAAAAALGHAYLAPGATPSDRGLTEPDERLLGYFEPDYARSREAFRRAAGEVEARHRSVERGAIVVPARSDDDLTIDWVYVPAQARPRRLLIVTSGVHGIEGPTGSAVQRHFLAEVLPQLDLSELGVLMVHALNPFGFKHMRRVTERNVDLNRNFGVTPELFALKNEGYLTLNALLNPEQPVHLGGMTQRFFAERALLRVLRHGMPVLRQAALQGQYAVAPGVFFGGTAFEPQNAALETLLRRLAPDYHAVMVVDLHTGYGARGALHLLSGAPLTSRILEDTNTVFAGQAISQPQREADFYATTGSFIEWVGKLLDAEAQRYVPMVFELGTLDSHGLRGALDSMHRVVLENQGWHHGYATREDEEEVRRRFAELFYPSSPRWRTQALQRIAAVWPDVLERFGSL